MGWQRVKPSASAPSGLGSGDRGVIYIDDTDGPQWWDGSAWQSFGSGGGGGIVTSVTAGDTSIVMGGTSTDPTIETATLDVIATDHPPAAAVPMNSKKITGLANGSASSDAAAFGQIPLASTSNPVMDGSAAPGSAATWSKSDHVHPTDTGRMAAASTLHGIAAANANDGDIAVNTHKITGLSNGSAASDAAAFGQIPTTPVLAHLAYSGASDTYYGVSVTSLTAVDTTNLRLVVTAPASGKVLLEWSSFMSVASGINGFGGFLNGASNVGQGLMSNSSNAVRLTFRCEVTGLTPGNSYNFDLAVYETSTGSGPFYLYHGPTYGPITMTAWAL